MSAKYPPQPHLIYGYRWVIAKDLRGILTSDRHNAAGEHLVGYPYVDHTNGLSMHVRLFCAVDSSGDIQPTTDLNSQRVMLIVRYDVLETCEIKPLSTEQISALQLPSEPESLQSYRNLDVEPLRQIDYMHPLRAPGFPVDIEFVLPPRQAGQNPEQVWGRLERQIDPHHFECELIVQPHQDLGMNRGDRVLVRVCPVPQGVESLCVGKCKEGNAP